MTAPDFSRQHSEGEEPSLPARPVLSTHTGVVFDYYDIPLTEGTVWALQEDGKDGYDGLVLVEQGDHLTITSPNGDTLFEGLIVADRSTGWQRHQPNEDHGQPVALGRWVHWTQRGFSPDDWARLFILPEGAQPNRGVLVKFVDPS